MKTLEYSSNFIYYHYTYWRTMVHWFFRLDTNLLTFRRQWYKRPKNTTRIFHIDLINTIVWTRKKQKQFIRKKLSKPLKYFCWVFIFNYNIILPVKVQNWEKHLYFFPFLYKIKKRVIRLPSFKMHFFVFPECILNNMFARKIHPFNQMVYSSKYWFLFLKKR